MVNSYISTNGNLKININEINIQPGLMYNKITIQDGVATITTTSANGHRLHQTAIYEGNTNKLLCVKHEIHKSDDGTLEESMTLPYNPNTTIDGKIQSINNFTNSINMSNIFTATSYVLYTGAFDIESARSSEQIEYS